MPAHFKHGFQGHPGHKAHAGDYALMVAGADSFKPGPFKQGETQPGVSGQIHNSRQGGV